MNSITILDGGLFEYKGDASNNNKLNIMLDGSLHIRGGGIFKVNNLNLEGMFRRKDFIINILDNLRASIMFICSLKVCTRNCVLVFGLV